MSLTQTPSAAPVCLHTAEAGEKGEEITLQELSHARHIITQDDFFPEARELRGVFDQRFGDPRSISPERFLW